ncbi:MAG: hypothetical protein ACKVOR_03495 [Flavobacteriales bacterium]
MRKIYIAMADIIVNVPQDKLQFFTALLKELKLKFTNEEAYEVPEWQQQLIKERFATATADDYVPATELLDEIAKKHGIIK